MNKFYFAHSKLIYNTILEDNLKKEISNLGYNIICPNKEMGELGSIIPYLKKIDECKGTIAHEYEGFIGKGVYEEVLHTLNSKKPCFVLRNKKLYKISRVEVYESNDWKFKYGKIYISKP